ncbi:type VII toxin-antitoxin system HepT family RNase toxin [Pseudalkalibacillus caeni]|uniref:DUF86 domain-containing protein n=1 Tax=Exobacillus caeni TaxID=2574798 RepID=A0A5R9F714_9BACL|nr:DUF86 domain-containing protein [Pseudalkalibacillus caeni]TLS38831.1 DUF86 domain-containing protein [Pseudalkalibacillus caeni]
MYFVDRKKIEEALAYMEKCLTLFEERDSWSQSIERLALERISQTVIESIIDVGNNMIDGFIMRDPGSYEDIIDILDDEKVIKPEHKDPLKEIIRLRKVLVQQYSSIDHENLHRTLQGNLDVLKQFPPEVRSYLTKELGPVSAFLPEDDKH